VTAEIARLIVGCDPLVGLCQLGLRPIPAQIGECHDDRLVQAKERRPLVFGFRGVSVNPFAHVQNLFRVKPGGMIQATVRSLEA
jgi:hypothetical protein